MAYLPQKTLLGLLRESAAPFSGPRSKASTKLAPPTAPSIGANPATFLPAVNDVAKLPAKGA